MKGFVKISRYSGMREDLAQAGGGNSSFKISEDKMAIKASGYQLADLTETDGFALVNPRVIREAFLSIEDLDTLTDKESKEILEKAFIEGKRPSIETFLHAISGRYTLHTHSIVVNALTSRKTWEEELRKIFPDALYVKYATPGAELAKVFFQAYKQYGIEKTPEIVFLQNHGLVVSSEDAEGVIEKTEYVISKLEEYLGCDFSAYHELTKIWEMFPDKIIWKVTDKNVLEALEQPDCLNKHMFCPDCIVFLGKKILDLPDDYSAKDVEAFQREYAQPVVVKCKNHFYLVADSVRKALEIQSVLSFGAQVVSLNREVPCNYLSDEEQNFLLNWDAEKYRKKL